MDVIGSSLDRREASMTFEFVVRSVTHSGSYGRPSTSGGGKPLTRSTLQSASVPILSFLPAVGLLAKGEEGPEELSMPLGRVGFSYMAQPFQNFWSCLGRDSLSSESGTS